MLQSERDLFHHQVSPSGTFDRPFNATSCGGTCHRIWVTSFIFNMAYEIKFDYDETRREQVGDTAIRRYGGLGL